MNTRGATWPNRVLMLIVGAAFALPLGATWAQDSQPAAEEETPAPDAIDEVEIDGDQDDKWFAVVGATVHTVSGPMLRDATVLCKNGKIVEIGPRVSIPDGAELLEADGYDLYPGLVAVRTGGILGGGNPADTTNVFGLNMALGLAAGITTGVTGNDVAKLTFGSVDDILIKRGLFETLRYDTSSPSARRKMRQEFDRVRGYLRDLDTYNRDKATDSELKEPEKDWIRGNYAKYLRLLKGEAVAVMDANNTHDLLQVCELAGDYGIEVVVRGAYEGWTVAPELARAGVSAIVTPRFRMDHDDRLNRPNGSSIENASILHDHGVPITFIPPGSLFGPGYNISLGGLAGRDLQHLSMEAAFAVRGGMTNDEAIAAITLGAARILGIDDRVGSIEVGKDADFVITDGDLLHYTTQPRWTIVNGRIAYDKMADSLYSHIRSDPNEPPVEPDTYWPRRLGADW